MNHTPFQPGVSLDSTLVFYTPTNKPQDFFLYPLCLGHYNCKEPYRVERTSYDSFLLLYTISGHGELEIAGHHYHLYPGQLCLLDAYLPHQYYASPAWDILWCHFDGGNARESLSYLTDQGCYIASLRNPLSFEHDWRHMYDELTGKEPTSPSLLSYELQGFLTLLFTAKEESDTKAAPDYIDDTLYFINRNLASPISLESLAARVSLSPYHFARRFKEETGYSPYRYILISRINLAKFYLKSTALSIKDISYQCGFQSEHSFCTTFKTEVTMTPTQYRKGRTSLD